jgi:hypothetical protein
MARAVIPGGFADLETVFMSMPENDHRPFTKRLSTYRKSFAFPVRATPGAPEDATTVPTLSVSTAVFTLLAGLAVAGLLWLGVISACMDNVAPEPSTSSPADPLVTDQ